MIFKTLVRYNGLNLWNSLSSSLKSCQSVNEFKYVYKKNSCLIIIPVKIHDISSYNVLYYYVIL